MAGTGNERLCAGGGADLHGRSFARRRAKRAGQPQMHEQMKNEMRQLEDKLEQERRVLQDKCKHDMRAMQDRHHGEKEALRQKYMGSKK